MGSKDHRTLVKIVSAHHMQRQLDYLNVCTIFVCLFLHCPLAAQVEPLPWLACCICPPGPEGRPEPAGELPAGHLSLCSETLSIRPERTSPGTGSSPGRKERK